MTDVVVTGAGVVCSLGSNLTAFWSTLSEGRSGIKLAGSRCRWFGQRIAASIEDEVFSTCASLGIAAAKEAWGTAKLDDLDSRARVGLVMGTSAADLAARSRYELSRDADEDDRQRWMDESHAQVVTASIANALGLEGPAITVSTACTSSADAIGFALDLLRAGALDVVLAGGTDALADELFAGFIAMDAMSRSPCAPFSYPVGMTLGEGAGVLVLERSDQARQRAIEPLALLLGYGASSDAYHSTAPDPTGLGVAGAIRKALLDAGIDAPDVGYVNAHGTGTQANDPAEWRGVLSALGESARRIPVSSTKSYFGHTLGAAGVLELLATILALREQKVLPTLHFNRPRRESPNDPVGDARPRPHAHDFAISNNAAFGGSNASLVVGRRSGRRVSGRFGRPILLIGAAAQLDGSPSLTHLPPHFDLRGIDALTRLLLLATHSALEDAGSSKRELPDGIGLVAAAARMGWEAADDFWGSIRGRGMDRVSASAFSRVVLNAPAGAVSRLLSLRGPMALIAGGIGATLIGIVRAATMLENGRAECMVMSTAERVTEPLRVEFARRNRDACEAAAAFVLANDDGRKSRCAQLSGWSIRGPNEIREAIESASHGVQPNPREHTALYEVDLTRRGGPVAENLDAITLARAFDDLRSGLVRRAVVAAGDGRTVSVALLLEARGGNEHSIE